MSNRFVLLALSLVAYSLTAFSQRNCGSMDVLEMQLQEDPKRAILLEQIENHIQAIDASGIRAVEGVVTIPVVVHVLYSNAAQNISDAQIMSQIDVLNEDFRRTNSDADNTWSQAADTEIEFCLAGSDPLGNPTDGILRVPTSVTAFGTNDGMKSSASGGSDAWPASSYLNIWVCNIGGGILGYAQFPGGSPSTDGVVCGYQYFGTTGTATAPFNLGRTTTHEVGHWLNLRHIWGDGGCGADDFVSDTPKSGGANYGCQVGSSSCGSTDMVENYMDYSDDACMNLYTVGQKNRMRALFESGGYRASLLNSVACGEVVAPTCDDGIQNGDEQGVDCGGSNCAPCVCDGVDVTVSITFDNYPEETSWQITDGGSVVASGGTYASSPDGSTLEVSQCLPDGCYTFTIFDSYGDGICCSYGSGSYVVTDEFGNVLASGASFGSSDGGNFCVSGVGPQPTCDDGIQNGDETGIDCGGSCAACATCDDGVQNGDETGIDCGGSCAPCVSCNDGIQNGDETGIDCGGSCEACATCDDGIQNGDETGIDCGGSCAPCETGPCTYGVVNNATFEGGWGIWNDGGSDCRRSRQDRAYANGTFCVRLQDNTSTSVTYTDNLNLAGYEELTVSFRFTAVSMETGKDFWLQISTNGGASFTTVASYFSGSDFVNGPVYTSEVVVPGPFTSSTVVQFRSDGGNNGDRVYLDDIEISGCVVGGRWTDAVPDMADADAVVGSPFQALNLYPNPAQDVVQLDFVLAENVRFEWGVLDLLGRQLMAEQRTAQSGEQRLKLPVSDWPEGTYILYLRSEFGLESKRFIIQR